MCNCCSSIEHLHMDSHHEPTAPFSPLFTWCWWYENGTMAAIISFQCTIIKAIEHFDERCELHLKIVFWDEALTVKIGPVVQSRKNQRELAFELSNQLSCSFGVSWTILTKIARSSRLGSTIEHNTSVICESYYKYRMCQPGLPLYGKADDPRMRLCASVTARKRRLVGTILWY